MLYASKVAIKKKKKRKKKKKKKRTATHRAGLITIWLVKMNYSISEPEK